MFLSKWFQEWIDEKQCIPGQRFRIQCINAQKTDFAKDVVLPLSMKLHVDCCLICRSEKDSWGRVECVFP